MSALTGTGGRGNVVVRGGIAMLEAKCYNNKTGAGNPCETAHTLTSGGDAPRLHGLYHVFSHGAIPKVGDRAFLFPTGDAVSNEKLFPLIQQSLAGAERTTGRTRQLWLKLYHLLLQWWIE